MSSSEPLLLTVAKCLSLGTDRRDLLQGIPEDKWTELLRLTDEARLTLPLAARCTAHVPTCVQKRLLVSLDGNALRQERMIATYREVANSLNVRGVEFLVLKGLAQYHPYPQTPASRPQYDIDLYVPPEKTQAAVEAITTLGFESVASTRGPADHAAPLVRRSQWNWRGDYYDPDLPFSIEVHHRFWDRNRERLPVATSERFWGRCVVLPVAGVEMPALHPADALSYATWHLVRHLLRGNLKIFHVYELAQFLNASAADDVFWSRWCALADLSERTVEAVAFRLACCWFECAVHPAVQALIARMPQAVSEWFRLFEMSPLIAAERPNKDELFLHFALTSRWIDRARIARQRLFPLNPPKVGSASAQAAFLAQRTRHHAAALLPVLRSATRWMRSPTSLRNPAEENLASQSCLPNREQRSMSSGHSSSL